MNSSKDKIITRLGLKVSHFKKIFHFTYILLFVVPISSWAQSDAPMNSGEDEIWVRQTAVGITTGSKAVIGVDIVHNILRPMNVKIGLNYLKLSPDNYELDLSPFGLEGKSFLIDGDFYLSNIELLIEYIPFKNRKFRIVGGGAYNINNRIEGKFSLKNSFYMNDLEITPEETGYIKGIYRSQLAVSPYFGIGLGRSIPEKMLSFCFDAGVYYRGKPQIEIESTNLLAGNEDNAEVLERNFDSWRWLPNLSFRLALNLSALKKNNLNQ